MAVLIKFAERAAEIESFPLVKLCSEKSGTEAEAVESIAFSFEKQLSLTSFRGTITKVNAAAATDLWLAEQRNWRREKIKLGN